ncbi:MAG: hypothetical protein LWX70_12815 [Sphingobacteriia bacterium]|nr:hypothetical protein [Sphingobacteriia bacterium]
MRGLSISISKHLGNNFQSNRSFTGNSVSESMPGNVRGKVFGDPGLDGHRLKIPIIILVAVSFDYLAWFCVSGKVESFR